MADNEAFIYNGGKIEPDEAQDIRCDISETYLGNPVHVPVTIINREPPGLAVFLSAVTHGDELNGIGVVREVAYEQGLADLAGTFVCMPVVNVPAFLAQQQYLPTYDHDLNRSFPGSETSMGAKRMAHRVYRNFITPCDLDIDFHISIRGRTNMLHVCADMSDPVIAYLASAPGSYVITDSSRPSGMFRTESSADGTLTITAEMGGARHFQRELIDEALMDVESIFVKYGLRGTSAVNWPSWRTVVSDENEKTWLRADAGDIIDMHHNRGAPVHGGGRIYAITDPFKDGSVTVIAPFTGLFVDVLGNPVAYPGNPLCHLVEFKDKVRHAVEREQSGSPETMC